MAPNFLFDVSAIEADFTPARARIEPKGQINPRSGPNHALFIQVAVVVNQLFSQSEQGHRTVHRTSVYVDVIQRFCQALGQGALARCAESVYGNADAFHVTGEKGVNLDRS